VPERQAQMQQAQERGAAGEGYGEEEDDNIGNVAPEDEEGFVEDRPDGGRGGYGDRPPPNRGYGGGGRFRRG
jgi:hypothetical protein